MEFEYELTVPAKTPRLSPVSMSCQLSMGIVHHYEVVFPEGCNNLVSIAIYEGGFQCFPLNPDGAIKGNADPVEKTTFYPLETPPYRLTVKGWSPDCSYDHTVLLRFDILPREYFDKTADIQALIGAVTEELQAEYAGTAGSITEQLTAIAERVTPHPAEQAAETGAETGISPEIEAGSLNQLDDIDRAVIEAQIRQGWNDDRIVKAHIFDTRLTGELIREILPQLRELARGGDHA